MPYWFDGNNLIGQSAAMVRANPRICRAFLHLLDHYRRARGGRFLVYFDGDDPGSPVALPGIAIRYSAPVSADEAILRHLRQIKFTSEVIVVTNDHELRKSCRNAGALALDWSEFVAKMKSRPVFRAAEDKPQQKVDVDDWLRYFGIENADS